jgi:Domain of unknown function (DUF3560)
MITITHTHEGGTLIEGSAEGDGVYEVLKGLGTSWRYFPSLRQIGLGQSRDKAAQTWKINAAAEALKAAGHEVTVEVDDTQRRDVATIEADRAERAEARTERLGERAERTSSTANADYARARQMGEAIPFGQPMMPDHHSYGRDRRYRDRMGKTYDRAFTGMAEAERLAGRAEAAEANQSHRESVPATLRRIAKLEAEERSVKLDITGHVEWVQGDGEEWVQKLVKPGPRYLARLEVRADDLAEQIAYWREHVARAEAAGVKVWSKADFARDDFALSRGTWYQVQRVNAKSLTVMWGTNIGDFPAVTRDNVRHAMGPSDRTGTISYDEIRGRKSAAEMAEVLAAAEANVPA